MFLCCLILVSLLSHPPKRDWAKLKLSILHSGHVHCLSGVYKSVDSCNGKLGTREYIKNGRECIRMHNISFLSRMHLSKRTYAMGECTHHNFSSFPVVPVINKVYVHHICYVCKTEKQRERVRSHVN